MIYKLFMSENKTSYDGGNVQQLGNYSNSTNNNTLTQQQIKNRENLLNTLIKGSPTPNNIKRCSELISTCKKKNVQ